MEKDILFCAQEIVNIILPQCKTFQDLIDFCADHNCQILPDPKISIKKSALFIDGVIIISTKLSYIQYLQILSHEIVHCLSYNNQLNYLNTLINSKNYNRLEFIENVARETSRIISDRLK